MYIIFSVAVWFISVVILCCLVALVSNTFKSKLSGLIALILSSITALGIATAAYHIAIFCYHKHPNSALPFIATVSGITLLLIGGGFAYFFFGEIVKKIKSGKFQIIDLGVGIVLLLFPSMFLIFGAGTLVATYTPELHEVFREIMTPNKASRPVEVFIRQSSAATDLYELPSSASATLARLPEFSLFALTLPIKNSKSYLLGMSMDANSAQTVGWVNSRDLVELNPSHVLIFIWKLCKLILLQLTTFTTILNLALGASLTFSFL